MNPRDKLVIRAAAVARSNRDAWDEFVSAMQAYSGYAAEACVNADPVRLQTAQGNAQMAARLLELFRNAPAEADKIEAGRVNKK